MSNHPELSVGAEMRRLHKSIKRADRLSRTYRSMREVESSVRAEYELYLLFRERAVRELLFHHDIETPSYKIFIR